MMSLDVERGEMIKICGIRSTEAARAAAIGGANALGFILAKSRRQVAPGDVAAIRASLESGPVDPPAFVGVTVNASATDLRSWVHEARLDYIQLSGDETPDILDELDFPVIKTIHVTAGMSVDSLVQQVDRWFDRSHPAEAILIDAKVDGAYGGSGIQSDWTVSTALAERYPAILAGGLKPGNVFEGIQIVRPRGVDVSTGVEIAGDKDTALIEAFIAHARQGFAGARNAQVRD